MTQATHMAQRMFSMLPLAIPFVGVVAPGVPAPDISTERSDSTGNQDQNSSRGRRGEDADAKPR